MSFIKLLGYAPDADPTIVGVITGASGVVPSLKGMKGAPSPAGTGISAAAATVVGAATVTLLDDTNRIFIGTDTKLYEANSTSFADVSRAATYSATASTPWRFGVQGNVSLASNQNDTIQASVSSGAFSCISGAPKASFIEVVDQFVFAAYTNDSTFGTSPDRWWCSALGDYTSWTPSISTQAATGRLLAAPGPITGIKKYGQQVIIYKKRAMFLGTYVGPPVIWAFQQIPGEVGALQHEAIVNIGTEDNPKHIFPGTNDFYIFDGSKPRSIGTNRVKNTVFGALLDSRYYAVKALHDRTNALVYFYYPVSDSSIPDHCVVYNYRTDQWGVDDRQVEAVLDYVTPGITYNALGNYYATYEDLPNLPYDSAFLGSSVRYPAIIDTNHQLKTLTGQAGNSAMTLGDIGDENQVSTLRRVRPRFITAPTTALQTNYYKMNSGDSLTVDQLSQMNNGKFDLMRDARWHRLSYTYTGDWEQSGLVPDLVASGLE
jgi:hypothetical protein